LTKLEKEIAEKEQMQQQQEEEQTMRASQQDDAIPAVHVNEEMEKITEMLGDITVSALRIQQALEEVSKLASDADGVRKELYHKYRKDHQFHGYQGFKDPKGLLRSLSQTQSQEFD